MVMLPSGGCDRMEAALGPGEAGQASAMENMDNEAREGFPAGSNKYA